MGKEGGAHCKITCSVKAKQPPLEHNLLSGVMSMKCDRRSESRKGQFALPFNKRSVSNGILACCHPTRGQEKVRHREKSQACTRPSPTLPNTGHPHKLSIGNPHFFSPSLHFIAPFYLRRNKTPRVTGHGWGKKPSEGCERAGNHGSSTGHVRLHCTSSAAYNTAAVRRNPQSAGVN